MKPRRRNRIAFIGVGVGMPTSASAGQGIPTIRVLLEKLSGRFDIVIYSLIPIEKDKVPPGIQTRQVTTWRLPQKVKYTLLLMSFVLDQLQGSFDILHAISAFPAGRMAIILGKIFRIPTVVQLIGSEMVKMPDIGYGDLLHPQLEKIVRRVCLRAKVLVVVSEYQKKIVEQHLEQKRSMEVLPLRIEAEKFPYQKHYLSVPVQFLHIAAFLPVKDQDTLFRAFAMIAKTIPARLTVIGDGFHVLAVEKMLTELEIQNQVRLIGVVKNGELGDYFSNAHILLHTSRYESGCGVAQEAMASGVPVCATEVGILSDLGDAYAVVAPPHDPDALAAKTLALINDPELYHKLQMNAYQYIVRHDAAWAARQYERLFESLLRTQTSES